MKGGWAGAVIAIGIGIGLAALIIRADGVRLGWLDWLALAPAVTSPGLS